MGNTIGSTFFGHLQLLFFHCLSMNCAIIDCLDTTELLIVIFYFKAARKLMVLSYFDGVSSWVLSNKGTWVDLIKSEYVSHGQ